MPRVAVWSAQPDIPSRPLEYWPTLRKPFESISPEDFRKGRHIEAGLDANQNLGLGGKAHEERCLFPRCLGVRVVRPNQRQPMVRPRDVNDLGDMWCQLWGAS